MRIALDSTPLIKPAGGIPRYVVELSLALARGFPGDEIHLLSDQPDLHVDPRLAALPNVILDPSGGPRFFGKWWSAGLPWELKRRKIDVFHGTDFAIPYLPVAPSVMTVHDLSPWKPEPIRPPGSERVRSRAPKLCGPARRIITPTAAVARDLEATFRIPPEKITAVHHGVRSDFNLPSDGFVTEQLQKHGVESPFVLYVGSSEPRKNLAFLEAAFGPVRERNPRVILVEAGPDQSAESTPGITRIGPLDEKQLSVFLSQTSAFLYPSLYEGFGLPVVEAMQAGAPVIASDDEAIVEAAGGAALHLSPDDPAAWTQAILQALEDAQWAREMKRRGVARASELSWERCALRTRAVYEQAIRGD